MSLKSHNTQSDQWTCCQGPQETLDTEMLWCPYNIASDQGTLFTKKKSNELTLMGFYSKTISRIAPKSGIPLSSLHRHLGRSMQNSLGKAKKCIINTGGNAVRPFLKEWVSPAFRGLESGNWLRQGNLLGIWVSSGEQSPGLKFYQLYKSGRRRLPI